jgi:hypothetical protein
MTDQMDTITGKTLIAWGYRPGPWFAPAIGAAEAARTSGAGEAAIRAIVDRFAPPQLPPSVDLRKRGEISYTLNIRDEGPGDADNIVSVEKHMAELMRVPTLVAGTIMPDACPSSSAPGTIPVGGVVAAKGAIHPGMHSADICCSMAVSVFGDTDPTAILDAGMKHSHVGAGGRPYSHDLRPPDTLMAEFEGNKYLAMITEAAVRHFATQGDGNHFFYVGRLASTGQVALVTHHGSRKPGALLYKAGMETAERYRRDLSPETPPHNAWIPYETDEGRAYWAALQLIRTWTKKNHFAIHDHVAGALGLKVKDRFWNEHNFVFRKSDGLCPKTTIWCCGCSAAATASAWCPSACCAGATARAACRARPTPMASRASRHARRTSSRRGCSGVATTTCSGATATRGEPWRARSRRTASVRAPSSKCIQAGSVNVSSASP